MRVRAVKKAILNLEFKKICFVESDLCSVFFMLINPVKDESSLVKVRERKRAVDRVRELYKGSFIGLVWFDSLCPNQQFSVMSEGSFWVKPYQSEEDTTQ